MFFFVDFVLEKNGGVVGIIELDFDCLYFDVVC